MTTYSLYELNEYIRRVMALNFPEAYWIRCELSQVKLSKGHYFLDVVEKGDDTVIAQSQAVLWNRDFKILQKKLGSDLMSLLQEGLEVQFLARVDFHERYGLKLIIEDFDTAYSLGKLEQKRQEAIRQLKQLDLLDKNKRNYLPPVVQRIAVLTSETAAGYQDFREHLAANTYGYRFDCQLFTTAVQGALAENEMLAQLGKISSKAAKFDAVVVIRGGGSKLDLSVFDSLELCKGVANLPIPVLTGIGHDVDESVLDLVAYQSLKTPTAVADFILHRNLLFENEMLNLGLAVQQFSQTILKEKEIQLQYLWRGIESQSMGNLRQHQLMLDYIAREIPHLTRNYLGRAQGQMEALEKICHLLSPEVALKRGFSITTRQGIPVVSIQQLSAGDEIETLLHDGAATSTIKTTQQ
ncbi:MAG: exodeoxyribonuclease VII large subunit [Saprospiraceae bacterium]